MNKHFHVSLVDQNDNDLLSFLFHDTEDSFGKQEALIALVDSAESTSLKVVHETCYDDFCSVSVKAEEATYKRVPGSMGYDYIVNEVACTCPDSIYRNRKCKHQEYFKTGMYDCYENATQTDFNIAEEKMWAHV